jgi:hypothetical protein
MLPRKDIEKFQQIYKEEFGEEINDAEAQRQATKLLTLVKTVAEYLEFKQSSKNEKV